MPLSETIFAFFKASTRLFSGPSRNIFDICDINSKAQLGFHISGYFTTYAVFLSPGLL